MGTTKQARHIGEGMSSRQRRKAEAKKHNYRLIEGEAYIEDRARNPVKCRRSRNGASLLMIASMFCGAADT